MNLNKTIGHSVLVLPTTRAELKDKWKRMYRERKKFGPRGALPSGGAYGYFSGKMEYTAWLLLRSREVMIRE